MDQGILITKGVIKKKYIWLHERMKDIKSDWSTDRGGHLEMWTHIQAISLTVICKRRHTSDLLTLYMIVPGSLLCLPFQAEWSLFPLNAIIDH